MLMISAAAARTDTLLVYR